MSALIEVREKSTQDFDVVVKDANGDVVTPTAMTYTLTDRDGTVINSIEDESVTPSTSTRITLKGADLQLISQSNRREYRILTVETDRADATKPENIQIGFWVTNLVAIT